MAENTAIKLCPGCGKSFTLHDIFYSLEIEPDGLAIDPEDFNRCYLHFTHLEPKCRSSFVIPSSDIEAHLPESERPPSHHRQPECSGYCARIDELRQCKVNCRLQEFRALVLDLIERRKTIAAR